MNPSPEEVVQHDLTALRHDLAIYTENFTAFLELLAVPEPERDYQKAIQLAKQMRQDLAATSGFYSMVVSVLKDRKE